MSTQVLERVFQSPSTEITNIQNDLYHHYGEAFASSINSLAIKFTEKYHSKVSDILMYRFIKINQLIEQAPKNMSKEQHNELLSNIFKEADANGILRSIQTAIYLDDIHKLYDEFIDTIEQSSAIKGIYKKVAFNKETIKGFNQVAFTHMSDAIHSLQLYIKSLKDHQLVINEIASKQGSNSFLKAGASILGLGIPFLGLGLGAILNSGDKQKISESIGNVLNHIDYMSDEITETLSNLINALHLLFLSLFAGTILAANEALLQNNSKIGGLDEKTGMIIYQLTDPERMKFKKWMATNLDALDTLAEQRRWKEAIVLVNQFYKQIVANPIHARTVIIENRASIIIAHSYYYAIYQEALLLEYKNGHVESFLQRGKALLESLITLPLISTLPKFTTYPAHFIFLFTKLYYEKNGVNYIAENLLDKADQRYEQRLKNGDFIIGDYDLEPAYLVENTLPFYLVDLFEGKVKGFPISQEDKKLIELFNSYIRKEDIQRLIEIDASLNHSDDFTKFLNGLMKDFSPTRKIVKWGSMIVLLMAVVYLFISFLLPKLSEWVGSFQHEEPVVTNEVIPLNQLILITGETVNIRNAPNYTASQVIGQGQLNEEYVYLGEEVLDEGGTDITWYKIDFNGNIGYVSKKFSVIKEEE